MRSTAPSLLRGLFGYGANFSIGQCSILSLAFATLFPRVWRCLRWPAASEYFDSLDYGFARERSPAAPKKLGGGDSNGADESAAFDLPNEAQLYFVGVLGVWLVILGVRQIACGDFDCHRLFLSFSRG